VSSNTEGKGVMSSLSRYVLPVLVIAAGVFGARVLIASKTEAARRNPGERAVAVRVSNPVLTNYTVTVAGHGYVVPARKVDLRVQVGGRVAWRHPALEMGGRMTAGEVLVEIEREDYTAALAEAQSVLGQAQLNEALELQRQLVAADEWRQSGATPADEMANSIMLRKPHVEAARLASLAAVEKVALAKRNLERTQVKVPFDAVVLRSQVELGSVLSPQALVAELAGTEVFHVEVALPVDSLAWLDGLQDGVFSTPLPVLISLPSGGPQEVRCTGHAIRLAGEVSTTGLMAKLLVAIDAPLKQGMSRLMLGAYVNCEIRGRTLRDVLLLPRSSLRDDDRVWLVGPEQRLEVRAPEVRWKDREVVLIGGGIAPESMIISSALPAAIPGMLLNVIESGVSK